MSEGQEFDCNNTFPELSWGSTTECGQLPISVICLLAAAAGWGGLLVITGLRWVKNVRSAARNTVVAKKMQHLQAWTYSFFHTMVYLSTMFSVITLLGSEEYTTAIFVSAVTVLGTLFESQVDVIGSRNRSPGVNGVNLVVSVDYLVTTHLAKVVWKTSGHKEIEENDSKPSVSAFGRLCCLQELDNTFTPKVYDIKDVVGMQGAFVGLPVFIAYMLTVVRSNSLTEASTSVADVVEDAPSTFDVFEFDTLTTIAVAMSFLSAILPPILGDWETYSKSKLKSLGSVVLRSVEVLARAGFYTYFIDFSQFAGLVLLGVEAGFMFLTNITANDASAGGRTGSAHHYILSTWESVMFTNYRRISVDKELVYHNTLMPTTIEFIRFIERTLATLIGYAIMAADIPGFYVSYDVTLLPALFFVGVVANGAVVAFNVVNFLLVNRSSMKSNDMRRLKGYWAGLCCGGCSTTRHLNRDNVYGEGGITYV